MKKFKSPWFYWHTGQTRIAVISLAMSGLLTWLLLVATVGCSVWSILLAVFLDVAGLWLALVYLVVLRAQIPDLPGLSQSVDLFLLTTLLLPALLGFLANRGCAFLVAKICGYPFSAPLRA